MDTPFCQSPANRLGHRLAAMLMLGSIVGIGSACGKADELIEIEFMHDIGRFSQDVVFGPDDRQEAFAFLDRDFAAAASGFSVALINKSLLDETDPTDVRFDVPTLGQKHRLCPEERFVEQPSLARCSGTLIAEDLVLTAGHCMDEPKDCETTRFVFDFSFVSQGQLGTITSENMYSCAEIVTSYESRYVDYAVVRLERAVRDRTPAKIRWSTDELAKETQLLVSGYPNGIPLKLAGNGWVMAKRSDSADFFEATLDTFRGNSGSGIFVKQTGELAGVLVTGWPDFVRDHSAKCKRVNRLPEAQRTGEIAMYVRHATDALCAKEAHPHLCQCGNGVCDPHEDSAQCWVDCGARCRDGACNGDETPADCPQDCGACGDGHCDPQERFLDSCCQDCGCTDGFVCNRNVCAADPSLGDSCANAVVLPLTAFQTIQGTTTTAQDKAEGSCSEIEEEGLPDRVYQITLTSEMEVDFQVVGFDTVMYLRSSCDDKESEIICNDDGSPPGGAGSRIHQLLGPGTYYLYIDGLFETGSYVLTAALRNPTGCADADADGICDSDDGCPNDSTKRKAGVCGCGMPDIDSDGDWFADCVDACPSDPWKALFEGPCGCGAWDPWLAWLSDYFCPRAIR